MSLSLQSSALDTAAPLAAALTIRHRFSGHDSVFWKTRIGLHDGEFVLGTVGAREHLEYRAVGDTVNTASRVQSLNKTLGTQALATAGSLADERIGWRPLGRFLLAGKQNAVVVGEPLAFKGALSVQDTELIETFGHGLGLLERDELRDALATTLYVGTSEIQRNLIAGLRGLT